MKKCIILVSSILFFMQGNQLMGLSLTSPTFTNNTLLAKRSTKDGDNKSPHLLWQGAPAGTKSFALIVDDPDAPVEKPWVHWVLFNIPNSIQEIKEGEIIKEAIAGINDFGNTQYDGPKPPKGHGKHHYIFTLYALDTLLPLKKGATKEQLLDAMQGHILAKTSLTGLYER